MSYNPTKTDPGAWLRPAMKADGFEYYELVLCYVDDVVSMSANPELTLRGLQLVFKIKDDKIAEPDIYLGAQLEKMDVDGFECCWTMSAEKYFIASVRNNNVDESLQKKGLRLPSKSYTPLPPDYRPELDTSNE
jgi:hypothetical protein